MTRTPFPSPFFNVLGTNHSPSSTELREITEILEQPQEQLDALNDRVARLEMELANAKSERAALHDYIQDHRALMSPFRRLPHDVIREIFLKCLDEFPVRSTQHAPLLLTTVCKAWQKIALGAPRLWSSIHIFIPSWSIHWSPQARCTPSPHHDRLLIQERLLGIERWLDRSKSVPICFSLSFSQEHNYPDGPSPWQKAHFALLQSVVNVFLRYRTRWKAVHISGSDIWPILDPLASVTPEEVPKLEALHINLSRLTEHWDDNQRDVLATRINFDSLLRAQSLQQLSITTNKQFDILRLHVQWDRITELSLQVPSSAVYSSHWSGPDMLSILSHLNVVILRKFSCSIQLPVSVVAYPLRETLDFPSLKTLSVNFKRDDVGILPYNQAEHITSANINAFFSYISCPSLVDLTILIGKPLFIGNTLPAKDFLERSGFLLKTFRTDLCLSRPMFRSCLSYLPKVTTLTYVDKNHPGLFRLPISDSFSVLEALLRPRVDSAVPCQSLENLFVSGVDPSDAGLVTRVARERLQLPQRTFRCLKASFSAATNEQYRSQVEELRQGGLAVKWVTPSTYHPVGWDDPDMGMSVHGVDPWTVQVQTPREIEY